VGWKTLDGEKRPAERLHGVIEATGLLQDHRAPDQPGFLARRASSDALDASECGVEPAVALLEIQRVALEHRQRAEPGASLLETIEGARGITSVGLQQSTGAGQVELGRRGRTLLDGALELTSGVGRSAQEGEGSTMGCPSLDVTWMPLQKVPELLLGAFDLADLEQRQPALQGKA
jgi:hypothetical protein